MRTILTLVVLAVILNAGFVAFAESPPAVRGSVRLGGALEGYVLVRCLPDEGRIVLRHDDSIWVLHQGDTVPGTSVRVTGISSEQIVLIDEGDMAKTRRAASRRAFKEMIVVQVAESGALEVKLLSAGEPSEGRVEAPRPHQAAGGSSSAAPPAHVDGNQR
jgi:hypothetical protein